MTLTEAPPRPTRVGREDVGRFQPPVIPPTPRPASSPDRTRPGSIGAVAVAVRTVSAAAPEEVVDARIAARRADAEDEADRLRLRPILAVLGVLVAAVVVLAVLWSPLFSVHRITLHGVTDDQRGAILAAANIQNGSPLVTVDVAAARARVAALPMVDGVRVARVWPRSVVITVALRTALASIHVPGSGGLAVVDVRGTVIATSLSEDPSFDPKTAALPVVESGLTQVPAPGARIGARDRGAVRTLAALDSDLRSRVREVRLDGRVVRMHLIGEGRFADVSVVFGQPNDLRAKALALRSVFSHGEIGGNSITAIDVSVPDAPILTERQ